MKNIQDLRLAFVGCSHWHARRLVPSILKEKLNVVAVSDRDTAVAKRFAENFSCKVYSDDMELLDTERPDFVFAFARHNEMTQLARQVISRGIALSIEKPVGLNEAEVRSVKELADQKGVFCAVPFVWRYSEAIQILKNTVEPNDYTHLSCTFISGPTSRYLEKDSAWMLQEETSGGGCMPNLANHFLDVALYLTGSKQANIIGSAYQYVNGFNVEDYATVLARVASGATISLQVGYAYPMEQGKENDNPWNFVTKDGYYTLRDGSFEMRRFGQPVETKQLDGSSSIIALYGAYAALVLRDFVEGKPPMAGINDMLNVRIMLDEINRQGRNNRGPSR